MNIIEALALIAAASQHVGTLIAVVRKAQSEGRTELTPEEIAMFRARTLASEERLEGVAHPAAS
jgi:hypothetical protein